MLKRQLLFLSFLCIGLTIQAQEKVRLIGIGHASILDTYLSQENYSGPEVRLLHSTTSFLDKHPQWSRTFTSQLSFSNTSPRSNDGTNLAGMLEYSFAMNRHFQINENLDIAFGGLADCFLGGIYNTRNGNNPAQLKLGIDIAPEIAASYKFQLLNKPMRLNYRADLPLAGLHFSPAYGQSYYEIFSKGNYDHNICLASPFSAVNFSQMLTVDVWFGKRALTVGYLGAYRQADMNSLKYHNYSHSFVIGYTLGN